MLSTRIFGLACAVAVFVCLMAATASAQPLDKRTVFTFSGPIALPGVTLPAGQYLFRLADPQSSAKVVQVLNADGTKSYGLFFTISAERLEPASFRKCGSWKPHQGRPRPFGQRSRRPWRRGRTRRSSSLEGTDGSWPWQQIFWAFRPPAAGAILTATQEVPNTRISCARRSPRCEPSSVRAHPSPASLHPVARRPCSHYQSMPTNPCCRFIAPASQPPILHSLPNLTGHIENRNAAIDPAGLDNLAW